MVLRGIFARADALPGLEQLNSAERRILELIGEGLTNREIGDRLALAEKTIRNRVSILLNKLSMQTRTLAAVHISNLHRNAERKGDGRTSTAE